MSSTRSTSSAISNPETIGWATAAVRESVTRVRETFAKFHERIDELIAEGDRVVVSLTMSGVNTGTSPIGTPPTGKRVSTLGILTYRIKDGRIAEQWEVVNLAGMLQQLGHFPPPT